jgi:hypothetical protein
MKTDGVSRHRRMSDPARRRWYALRRARRISGHSAVPLRRASSCGNGPACRVPRHRGPMLHPQKHDMWSLNFLAQITIMSYSNYDAILAASCCQIRRRRRSVKVVVDLERMIPMGRMRNPRFAPEGLERRLSPSSLGIAPGAVEIWTIRTPPRPTLAPQAPLPRDPLGNPIPNPAPTPIPGPDVPR